MFRNKELSRSSVVMRAELAVLPGTIHSSVVAQEIGPSFIATQGRKRTSLQSLKVTSRKSVASNGAQTISSLPQEAMTTSS